MKEKVSAEDRVREIRRKTRKKYSSEEKVRIVLEGLRGEESIVTLCRREATSSEVSDLRQENEQLKQLVAEVLLKNRFLKKNAERSGLREYRYMRQSGSEKLETIRLVEDSELSVTATVRELGVPRSKFYG